ncbi:MAG: lipoprotein [Mucilaginibacter sp.]
MKKPYILLLLAIVVLSACQSKKQTDEVKSVTIEAISYQTQTMFTITCDRFDTYYKDKWKARTVTDKAEIDKLTKFLASLKTIDGGYEPNVRVKLLLTNTAGTVDTVCLDDKVTRIKGVSYETSVELANMVQE